MSDWPTPERSRTTIGSSGSSPRKFEGMRRLLLASERPDPAPAQEKLAARPGDADEQEPPLLLHLVAVAVGAGVGQDAFFQADDEHDRELQPLGRVQRHQGDGAGLLVPAIDGEARVISSRKSWIDAPRVFLVELAGGRDQLVEVGQPVLAVVPRFGRRGVRDSRSGSGARG